MSGWRRTVSLAPGTSTTKNTEHCPLDVVRGSPVTGGVLLEQGREDARMDSSHGRTSKAKTNTGKFYELLHFQNNNDKIMFKSVSHKN